MWFALITISVAENMRIYKIKLLQKHFSINIFVCVNKQTIAYSRLLTHKVISQRLNKISVRTKINQKLPFSF